MAKPKNTKSTLSRTKKSKSAPKRAVKRSSRPVGSGPGCPPKHRLRALVAIFARLILYMKIQKIEDVIGPCDEVCAQSNEDAITAERTLSKNTIRRHCKNDSESGRAGLMGLNWTDIGKEDGGAAMQTWKAEAKKTGHLPLLTQLGIALVKKLDAKAFFVAIFDEPEVEAAAGPSPEQKPEPKIASATSEPEISNISSDLEKARANAFKLECDRYSAKISRFATVFKLKIATTAPGPEVINIFKCDTLVASKHQEQELDYFSAVDLADKMQEEDASALLAGWPGADVAADQEAAMLFDTGLFMDIDLMPPINFFD